MYSGLGVHGIPVQPVRLLRGDLVHPGVCAGVPGDHAAPRHVRPQMYQAPQGLQGHQVSSTPISSQLVLNLCRMSSNLVPFSPS